MQQEPDIDPYQRDLALSVSNLIDELHRHAAFMSRWSSGDEELEQANRALRRSFQEYDYTVSERTDRLLELWRPVEDDDDDSLVDSTDEIVLESGTTIAVISRYDYLVDELPRTADALIGEVPVGGIQLTILPTEKLPVDDALAWPPDEANERAWLIPDGELLRGDIFIPVLPSE